MIIKKYIPLLYTALLSIFILSTTIASANQEFMVIYIDSIKKDSPPFHLCSLSLINHQKSGKFSNSETSNSPVCLRISIPKKIEQQILQPYAQSQSQCDWEESVPHKWRQLCSFMHKNGWTAIDTNFHHPTDASPLTDDPASQQVKTKYANFSIQDSLHCLERGLLEGGERMDITKAFSIFHPHTVEILLNLLKPDALTDPIDPEKIERLIQKKESMDKQSITGRPAYCIGKGLFEIFDMKKKLYSLLITKE